MMEESNKKLEQLEDLLKGSFEQTMRTKHSALMSCWTAWTDVYFKKTPFSLDEDIKQAEKLIEISGGDIDKGVDYLEYLYENDLLISEETWNDFIINRRNAGTKVGT